MVAKWPVQIILARLSRAAFACVAAAFLLTAFHASAHPLDDLCELDPWACQRNQFSGFGGVTPWSNRPTTEGLPWEENSSTVDVFAEAPVAVLPVEEDSTGEETTAEETTAEETSLGEETSPIEAIAQETVRDPAPARSGTIAVVPTPSAEQSMPIQRTMATVAVTPAATPTPSEVEESATPNTVMEPQPVLPPVPPTAEERTVWDTVSLYVRLGYEHILPKGLDHILFVLALFLASTRLRSLIAQITAFTVAHTITLGLAASGLVTAPSDIVEPLIALSIAFVAIENLFFKNMTRWRPFVVFAFGLFHGLGFASVLLELGLPQGHFAPALLSFNIGVELGQLTVIALALVPALLLQRLLKREHVEHLYRPIVVVPASLCIAVIGAFWAIERIAQSWGAA